MQVFGALRHFALGRTGRTLPPRRIAGRRNRAHMVRTRPEMKVVCIGGGPADYAKVLEREAERDARAVKTAGLKVE